MRSRTGEKQKSFGLRKAKEKQFEEDPLQFLWAVSYSDLLMVLMCFFVIYFEMSSQMGTSPVERILKDLEEDLTSNQKKQSSMASNKTNSISLPTTDSYYAVPSLFPLANLVVQPVINGFSSEMQQGAKDSVKKESDLDIRIHLLKEADKKAKQVMQTEWSDVKGEGLIIDFPDNIFPPGKFTLTKAAKSKLRHVLKVIGSEKENVSLIFVGHSDDTPLRHRGILDSNFVLSNLRAAKAVEFAIANGFDPRWVSSQGVGEYIRNTRSMSIRIRERLKR